jgi:cytochrome c oxidase assembly protein subunit 15
MTRTAFSRLAALTALLALVVILLGAYVRLSDAGLGCPDWPGCYGRLIAPSDEQAVAEANAAFPHRPVESHKAWKEMVHRYLASGLGLAIIGLAIGAWQGRGRDEDRLPVLLPTLLVGLVIFQGLLGMWTVTLLVKPAVVTAHLAGGLATLALLWWLALRTGGWFLAAGQALPGRLRPFAWGALTLVCVQILLGGWTSTNYAAMACIELPTCYGGLWWPPTDFGEAFVLWRGLGVNYEFGVLESPARTAIHLTHRIGALVVLLAVGTLALTLIRRASSAAERGLGLAIAGALLLQIGLGIANVIGHLPLPVAVAHNGGAALLLLTLITLIHALTAPAPGRAPAPAPRAAANARYSL